MGWKLKLVKTANIEIHETDKKNLIDGIVNALNDKKYSHLEGVQMLISIVEQFKKQKRDLQQTHYAEGLIIKQALKEL